MTQVRTHHVLRSLLAAILFAGSALLASAAPTHLVRKGETLSSIATRYGISTGELARANNLKDADMVKIGQKLEIPSTAQGFTEHTVRKGESLATIAKGHKTTVADIRAHNVLSNPNHITAGQRLRIPKKGTPALKPPSATTASSSTKAASATDRRRTLPASIQASIDSVRVSPTRWKNVVVHHSGTKVGSGKGMDRYHREERRMENGLAYHFVIGNGNGMGDGEIFIGKRWREQLDGGHLAIPALNANSLGICLVGDFESGRPTARQLDALEALSRALMRKARVTRENVTTHRLIHPKHTLCPGRNFPSASFARRLAQP